ncbi:universal stress protein [Bradyrhizobium viridifuturi]|uniref:universal stress protein n=1 Tax=Bradyrhizobium viridifuturi TaxID=1654716 RepID=UPI00067ED6B2|nr:universal stress protein [Bradyrhizobium viridifuturi]
MTTIKDVMVQLDGTSGDDARLAAANQIAEIFDSHITGLFFNVLSSHIPDGLDGVDAKGLRAAKEAGDASETIVFQRLTRLERPTNLRRFDVGSDTDIPDAALLVARTGDAFVALRPNGRAKEPEELIENLLYGTGRHLFLVPDDWKGLTPLDNAIVAWNGSRESARALAEALPYLQQASKVGVLVIQGKHQTDSDALKANDAVLHLRHHGINAVKYRAVGEEDETADVLVAECRALGANLLVMGSYGHSRLHELLPGSTTSRILRRSPIPLLIAH